MITYPEGGIPGILLRQRQAARAGINNVRVQLIPIRPVPKYKITGPESVAALVREMEDYDREYAKILHLDSKNQVMGVENISIGSLSATIVHPREAVKGAILANSASVIFLHNHPSGICTASPEDDLMHSKLTQAFDLVGIKLLDSVIVGKGCYYAYSEGAFTRTPAQASPTIAPVVAELSEPKSLQSELEKYLGKWYINANKFNSMNYTLSMFKLPEKYKEFGNTLIQIEDLGEGVVARVGVGGKEKHIIQLNLSQLSSDRIKYSDWDDVLRHEAEHLYRYKYISVKSSVIYLELEDYIKNSPDYYTEPKIRE